MTRQIDDLTKKSSYLDNMDKNVKNAINGSPGMKKILSLDYINVKSIKQSGNNLEVSVEMDSINADDFKRVSSDNFKSFSVLSTTDKVNSSIKCYLIKYTLN